jgi:hypothetical protein
MRYGFSLLTTIAWGLWFGGMVALFLFVSYLFATDRPTAVVAAPKMFFAFERYQLIVAAAALIASAGWRMLVPRGSITVLFALFALCTVGVVLSATLIRAPMEQLREQGDSSGPQFQRLHKISVRVYSAQAILLLLGGITLHSALTPRSPRPPRGTATEAAPPTTPPA